MSDQRLALIVSERPPEEASVAKEPTTELASSDEGSERNVDRANSTPVTIMFEGLMVFHREAGGYELGILQDAPGHSFTINIESNPGGRRMVDVDHFKTLGNNWSLELRGTSRVELANIRLRSKGHSGRLDDNWKGQSDFGWIMDMESAELHGRALTLIPGRLAPIIHLRNGELYTKFKADKLERRQGTGEFSAFGFVAEVVALDIYIQRGEDLVLKVADSAKAGEIFSLPYDPLLSYRVGITNVPIHREQRSGEQSHFHLYYRLFSDVPNEERFEIRAKEPREHPFNDYPHDQPDIALNLANFAHPLVRTGFRTPLLPVRREEPPRLTCCGMACNAVLLGKRSEHAPLQ